MGDKLNTYTDESDNNSDSPMVEEILFPWERRRLRKAEEKKVHIILPGDNEPKATNVSTENVSYSLPHSLLRKNSECNDIENKLNPLLQKIFEGDGVIVEAKRKGDAAKEKAQNVNAGFFRRKEAIGGLKEACICNAEATNGALEAIEQVAKNEQMMSELFFEVAKIGMVDLASNRAVVKYIKKIMSEGAKESLSDETQAQLLGVVRDLEAKQDLYNKTKELEDRLIKDEAKISTLEKQLKKRELKGQKLMGEEMNLSSQDQVVYLMLKKTRLFAWIGMIMGTIGILLSIIVLLLH